jgi:hypothetical protein
LAASALSQRGKDKKQVYVMKVTEKLCKLKANSIFSFSSADLCEDF